MFNIHALPAGNGDALLLEYGTAAEKHHILVDGGWSTFAPGLVACLKKHAPILDLLVVTHVDLDHIGGILGVLAASSGIKVKEVWFNGFVHLTPRPVDHLSEADLLGPQEGEQLTELIVKRKIPWNAKFNRGSVVVPAAGELPTKFVSDLKLTLLSPTWDSLSPLKDIWQELVKGEGLVPDSLGPRLDSDDAPSDLLGDEDDLEKLADRKPPKSITPANRSSIALLAEYDGRRCLLAGDAAPDVLVSSLKRLAPEQRQLHLFKVPHHGSHSNVTVDLVEQARCPRYLFTTDGTGYSNPHPHREAVARAVVYGGPNAKLLFNYDCLTTKGWKKEPADTPFHYTAAYGSKGLFSTKI